MCILQVQNSVNWETMESNTDEERGVSIKSLRTKTRALICDLLNPQMYISASNGTPRYWKGLAGLCQIGTNYEASLHEDANPTSKVLNLWYEKDPLGSTVQQFLLFLEEMDRFDVIADSLELIDEDIRIYKENPQTYEVKPISLEADKYIITTDDYKRINEGLELENYDAFLLYDQDDIDFATQMLEIMEKNYNMRFCVKDRDLVGGGLEMDKMVRLITERCNRLIVILSDSFFKSSANDYYLSFAHAYGIESQRKIIPCQYKDFTTIPNHMKFLFILDYRRMAIFNFWEKLRDTIKVADPEKMKYNRSRSDNGQQLRSVLHENNDPHKLKPLNHGVKFSSSVGDLKSFTLDSTNEQFLNPSTSADNLGPYLKDHKKTKKVQWFKKITSLLKKDKTSDCKTERGKSREVKKHLKRVATVAN